MDKLIKLGLVRIEGQLLYWFFDSSIGKFVLVVLINKTRYFFVLDEFLAFYGRISGSKVYLFVSSCYRYRFFLLRGLQNVNTPFRVLNHCYRNLVCKVFASKLVQFELGSFNFVGSKSFVCSTVYPEGFRESWKICIVFLFNLYLFFLRYFSFFLFSFFSIIFILRFIRIWKKFFLFIFFHYCLNYFVFSIFYFWYKFRCNKRLGISIKVLDRFFFGNRLLFLDNYNGLIGLWLFVYKFLKRVLVVKKFFFLDISYIRYIRRKFSFGVYFFRWLFFLLKAWVKLRNLSSSGIFDYLLFSLQGFFFRKRFGLSLGRGLSVGIDLYNWNQMLTSFSYYYYWNEGKVFGLWSTPFFRRISNRYYLVWLNNLSLFIVKRNFKQIFFLFNSGVVRVFKKVARYTVGSWWTCLFSMSMLLKLVFFSLFYDIELKRYWIIVYMYFVKLLVRNLVRFVRLWGYRLYLKMTYRDIYIWIWLYLMKYLFNFYLSSKFSINSKVIYRYINIIFLSVLRKFSYFRLSQVKSYFNKFGSMLFLSSLLENLRYLGIYVVVWCMFVYLLLVIFLCFFFSGGWRMRLYLDDSLDAGEDINKFGFVVVHVLEHWDTLGWRDMFKLTNYKVFGKLLGKNLGNVATYSYTTSVVSNLFLHWVQRRFSNVSWDRFVLLRLLKKSKNNYRWKLFALFLGRYGKIGLGNPEYFCNFIGAGRSWLNYYWNYNSLVVYKNKLQKVPNRIWFRDVKSLVYGWRINNLLSLMNFGSGLYSNSLFKIVYRFVFRRVKYKRKLIFDRCFDYYRKQEMQIKNWLGWNMKRWLMLKAQRAKARKWRCMGIKPTFLDQQRLKLEQNRIKYRVKHYLLKKLAQRGGAKMGRVREQRRIFGVGGNKMYVGTHRSFNKVKFKKVYSVKKV